MALVHHAGRQAARAGLGCARGSVKHRKLYPASAYAYGKRHFEGPSDWDERINGIISTQPCRPFPRSRVSRMETASWESRPGDKNEGTCLDAGMVLTRLKFLLAVNRAN